MVPESNKPTHIHVDLLNVLLLPVYRDNQVLGEKPFQDDFVNEVATEPSTLQVVPEVNTVFMHMGIVCHTVSILEQLACMMTFIS